MGVSLSVCMIVRDEEKDIGRCLESIYGIADELIVVDTGSVDNTRAIAAEYGAKLYDFEWVDDFSKARNYSIEKATGDWILILDGDDEFEKRDAAYLKELISRNDPADIYIFNTICYIGEKAGSEKILNVNIRLFKNIPELRYQGRIHESIISEKSDVRIEPAGISIYHYGYLNSNVREHDKRKRNMRILEQQLEEQPDNPYFLFCMGNEYFALGLAKKSLEYFDASFEKCSKSDIYVPKLIIRIIMAYQLLADYDNAILYIDRALSMYPQYTDVEYIRGTIYHSLGVTTRAVRSFERCLELGEPPAVLSFIIGVGSYKPCFALGCISHQLGDYSEALRYYNQALLAKPDYYDAIYSIGEVLSKTEKTEGELKGKLMQFFDTRSSVSFIMIADILFLQRQYALSLEFIEKAQKAGLTGEDLELLKAQCLFYLGEYDTAASSLKLVCDDSKYYRKSRILCCLGLLLGQNYAEAAAVIEPLEHKESFEHDHRVLSCLISIISTDTVPTLDEGPETSDILLPVIFEVLEILLATGDFKVFERSLELLNCIDNDKVLLMLAKLYNKYGYIDMAVYEILRSIKLFDRLDSDGAFILYKGYSIKK